MNYELLRQKSFKNALEVMQSNTCGCFYCLKIYPTSDIKAEYLIAELDGQETVWCPHCGIDAVIPEAPEYALDIDLLRQLYAMSFEIDDAEFEDGD